MPILRWLGFRPTTSLPSMRMAPVVGVSNPATMRSTVVLPQPEGPSSETNSPLSMFEAEILDHAVRAEGLFQMFDFKKSHQRCACVCLEKIVTSWMRPMQPQVMAKEITASAAGS